MKTDARFTHAVAVLLKAALATPGGKTLVATREFTYVVSQLDPKDAIGLPTMQLSTNVEVDAYARASLARINERWDRLIERELAFERYKAAQRLDCEGTAKQLHHLADVVAGLMNRRFENDNVLDQQNVREAP